MVGQFSTPIDNGIDAAIFGGLLPLVGDLFLRCGYKYGRAKFQRRKQRLAFQVGHDALALGAEDLFFQPVELLFKDEELALQCHNLLVLLLKNFLNPGRVDYAFKAVGHERNIAQNGLFSKAITV